MCPNVGLQTLLLPRNIPAAGYGCPGDSCCHGATSPFIFLLSAPDAFRSPPSPFLFLPPSQPTYLPFPILPPPPSPWLTVSTRSRHQHPADFLKIMVIFHTTCSALHDPRALGIASEVPEPPRARAGCAQRTARTQLPTSERASGRPRVPNTLQAKIISLSLAPLKM